MKHLFLASVLHLGNDFFLTHLFLFFLEACVSWEQKTLFKQQNSSFFKRTKPCGNIIMSSFNFVSFQPVCGDMVGNKAGEVSQAKIHPSSTLHLIFYPSSQSANHASIHSPARSFIHLSIHPPVHSSICPSTHPFIHPSVHPTVHLSIHPSVCPFIHLSIQPSSTDVF